MKKIFLVMTLAVCALFSVLSFSASSSPGLDAGYSLSADLGASPLVIGATVDAPAVTLSASREASTRSLTADASFTFAAIANPLNPAIPLSPGGATSGIASYGPGDGESDDDNGYRQLRQAG